MTEESVKERVSMVSDQDFIAAYRAGVNDVTSNNLHIGSEYTCASGVLVSVATQSSLAFALVQENALSVRRLPAFCRSESDALEFLKAETSGYRAGIQDGRLLLQRELAALLNYQPAFEKKEVSQSKADRYFLSLTDTALEYAVMKALRIAGYSDCAFDCGYAHHPCMVPEISKRELLNIASLSDERFVDFTVIADAELFSFYVLDVLNKQGFLLEIEPSALGDNTAYISLSRDRKSREVSDDVKSELVHKAITQQTAVFNPSFSGQKGFVGTLFDVCSDADLDFSLSESLRRCVCRLIVWLCEPSIPDEVISFEADFAAFSAEKDMS